MIVECPKCFGKFYFHFDEWYKDLFLDSIENNTNNHFNNKENIC